LDGQSGLWVAWRDEVAARVDQVLKGEVELVDAEETYRLVSAELADSGKRPFLSLDPPILAYCATDAGETVEVVEVARCRFHGAREPAHFVMATSRAAWASDRRALSEA
jgi:hypothetical protein